jgi:catechol 2,3-dioxygenase-like lactoylglutathione lyase family enzyme
MLEADQHIHAVTYLVRDYDEAIAWFVQKLGFTVASDEPLGAGKRWVLVSAGDGSNFHLLLAKADGAEQSQAIGKAAGGRVAFFLRCSDFSHSHARMLNAGVDFLEEPRHETYGTVAVFNDFYGNKWDLIEPTR